MSFTDFTIHTSAPVNLAECIPISESSNIIYSFNFPSK